MFISSMAMSERDKPQRNPVHYATQNDLRRFRQLGSSEVQSPIKRAYN